MYRGRRGGSGGRVKGRVAGVCSAPAAVLYSGCWLLAPSLSRHRMHDQCQTSFTIVAYLQGRVRAKLQRERATAAAAEERAEERRTAEGVHAESEAG